MYNRYIPQPDGSYRRSRMAEPKPPHPYPPPKPPQRPEPCESKEPIRDTSQNSPPPPCRDQQPPHRKQAPSREPAASGIGDFLRQLFPRGIDTEDLLILLLLLLMAGEGNDADNTALLTMALYLFL